MHADSPVQAGLCTFIRLIARTLRLKSTNENKYRYDRCIGIEPLSFGHQYLLVGFRCERSARARFTVEVDLSCLG